eukprot:246813_1
MASVVLMLFLFRQTKSGVIDCANTVNCAGNTVNCASGAPCTIYCNGTGLTTRICRNAVFNCPQDFSCTFFCDNDGWAGGDGSNAGRICENVVLNGATDGDLYVYAQTELNYSHATNEAMQDGTVNCGASSTCSVSCVGSQVCVGVTINGADTTEINFEASSLPTVRHGFLHTQAFKFGTINCGSNADCNINCLGEQSCPATQFNGGDNGNFNLEATGDDALAYILDATNIVCPDNADCNIVCQCTETDCSNTCAEIFIDGRASNTLTLVAQGDRVLFDTHISCPTDSLADECVITIDGGGNAYGTELINAIIVADSNSFLGFTLDCSEAIPCWTVNDDPFAPTWSAPMVICNADTALNCTMEQVNDEWDVFRCRDEGDDCDVSLSPTTATTAPSLDPTQINDPTQNPFNSIYTSLSTRDSYSDSSSESEDSSSSDEMDANAAFANNDQYLSDIMGVQNRDKINVTINVSKSPLVNLWVLFILLFVTIWISIICVHHCKQC